MTILLWCLVIFFLVFAWLSRKKIPKDPFNPFSPPSTRQSWDEYFLDMAKLASTRSKDKSLRVGAIIVGPNREVRSTGYNGLARGVEDDVKCRHERAVKNFWTVHGEMNALCNCARSGMSMDGCTMYIASDPYLLSPCATCAAAMIQCGIKRIVYKYPGKVPERWAESCGIAEEMLREAGVKVDKV
jgi:dCMP deaminase